MSPPDGLSEDVLTLALAQGWEVTVASLAYQPIGFGSHHWDVVDTTGSRWFVTVDELAAKRHTRDERLDAAFDRLRASLAAATDLAAHGHGFVVAPMPTRDGQPLVRMGDQFAVAFYPFIDGHSFDWGEFSTPAHQQATLDLVVAVHTAAGTAARRALADDFAVPLRDELMAALRPTDEIEDHGPYARPTARLLAGNATPVEHLLAHYDELVRAARARPARTVLTHGEPHPGNTMLGTDGWLLIDWDTALVTPPERDLWGLDPGDGSILGRYADVTGVIPLPEMLELYRIRWDLADLAVDVSRFRRPHSGNLHDDQTWKNLRSLVAQISGV